jgi:hypothetical protein
MSDDFSDTLRHLDRYPGRGDRLDPAVVVHAGRRRLRIRRVGTATGAGALVLALAIAAPAVLGARSTNQPPIGDTPGPVPSPTRSDPGTAQEPHTVGAGQVATAGQEIQAVNLPAALSATHMTAADVGGFDLTIDAADGIVTFHGDGRQIGLPELDARTTWVPAGAGALSHAGSWTTAYGTSSLPSGQIAAALVAGEVPPWVGSSRVYLLSQPSFALPDGIAAPTLELPTFAAPTGELLFAVVLRGAAAQAFESGHHGIVLEESDGAFMTPDCTDMTGCAAGIPGLPIGDALAGPIGHFTDAAVEPYVTPAPSLPLGPGTLPSDKGPTTRAPAAVQLATGLWASTGLSSRAGDLAAVDPSAAGTYYLAGDLDGVSMRIGVTTDAVPRLAVFGVTTAGMTAPPPADTSGDPYLAFDPLDVRIPQAYAYFKDTKSPTYTAGVTPAGTSRVFIFATWGFDLPNGTHVHALEVPTFAPPNAVSAVLKPGQRLWATSDAGAPATVGSGWGGYVFAANDGTILDPVCLDVAGNTDAACVQQDLGDFGAYDEIRAMLAKK